MILLSITGNLTDKFNQAIKYIQKGETIYYRDENYLKLINQITELPVEVEDKIATYVGNFRRENLIKHLINELDDISEEIEQITQLPCFVKLRDLIQSKIRNKDFDDSSNLWSGVELIDGRPLEVYFLDRMFAHYLNIDKFHLKIDKFQDPAFGSIARKEKLISSINGLTQLGPAVLQASAVEVSISNPTKKEFIFQGHLLQL